MSLKHMQDVVEYAIEQADTSGIEVLEGVSGDDQLKVLNSLKADLDATASKAERDEFAAEAFFKHLDAVMLIAGNRDQWDTFNNLKWEITFCGMTLKHYNCAALYNAVYDALKETYDFD